MNRTYSTEGIVLKVSKYKERDSLVKIITQDFGVLHAIASGTFSSSSKLSPALAESGYGRYLLVYGKTGWRIRGGVSAGNIFYELRGLPSWQAYRRVMRIVSEHMYAEDKSTQVFDELNAFINSLKEGDSHTESLEMIALLRIMSLLGSADTQKISSVENYGAYDLGTIQSASLDMRRIKSAINQGMQHILS